MFFFFLFFCAFALGLNVIYAWYCLLICYQKHGFCGRTVWNLVEHPDWITFDACNDSYGKTLKPWHEGQKWFDPGNMVLPLMPLKLFGAQSLFVLN